jgi:protease I
VVAFVQAMVRDGKLIAAVCHGPQLLIEVDAVRGKTVTSWPSVKTDLENAGATWVDREVVVDGQLITSRRPNDLAAFTEAIKTKLGAARPQAHAAP